LSSSRIPATRCSCLAICSRTTSTGVFFTHGLRADPPLAACPSTLPPAFPGPVVLGFFSAIVSSPFVRYCSALGRGCFRNLSLVRGLRGRCRCLLAGPAFLRIGSAMAIFLIEYLGRPVLV